MPLLGNRMVRIVHQNPEWVAESGARLFKGDPMLSDVGNCLPSVPFEEICHRGTVSAIAFA